MTNIWADSYKEIRKPFFDTESLEEERAKRDYDEDGKLESGAKEHAGAVHNAIQRKKGGKPDGQDTSSVKEETLVEVEKKNDSKEKKIDVMSGKNKIAINPQIKEEVEEWVAELVEEGYDLSEFTWDEMTDIYLDEAEIMKFQKEKGDIEARMASNKRRRSKTSSYFTPPTKGAHGADYRRRHNIAPTKLRSGSLPEEYELEEAPKIIGLQPASPRMRKGYPLGSSKVHDPSKIKEKKVKRVAEETELEEGTADMPPRGDAETVKVTDTQLASAKRRAAQTQIAADMARIKLQRTAAANESYDSIVEYLSQRNDAFENLEEGVFDPKKSKLRPASERSQRTMTPQQRSAAKKAAARTAEIHSKGETVLQGLRPQGKRGKVKTTPDAKPAAPAANRTVKGRYDKLAKAATSVLKSAQK
jgi:hypothetical protein